MKTVLISHGFAIVAAIIHRLFWFSGMNIYFVLGLSFHLDVLRCSRLMPMAGFLTFQQDFMGCHPFGGARTGRLYQACARWPEKLNAAKYVLLRQMGHVGLPVCFQLGR
jgi:hypothetical protein